MTSSRPRRTGHADARGILDTNTVILLDRLSDASAARAYDALIAAVALANELLLYTVNPVDFQDIDGLAVRSVPHPDADDSGAISSLRVSGHHACSAPVLE